MGLKPVTVSQLNEYISRVLTTDPLLSSLAVKGEISNLKYHSSGHVYFSLVDRDSKINCFLPASYVKNLSYELGDGLEVTLHGRLNVYKKGGYYSLLVTSVEVAGEGNLAMAFELLKQKLEKEGLFAREHKKTLPAFPKTLAVVTSGTGAALQDVLKIIKNRTGLVDVAVFPVQVQGEGAAAQMARTIERINRDYGYIDVIILGRGGGSAEDLWAFNEEVLARAVYASEIPIISAVGHEIDFSICDFAADVRAETPTAAAEMATPNDEELKRMLQKSANSLTAHLESRLSYCRLQAESCLRDTREALKSRLTELAHRMEKCLLTLKENDPAAVLSRGYALLRDGEGKSVTSIEALRDGRYGLVLADGEAEISISVIERRLKGR